ncbi:hypothetical protein XENOCAPTIV_004694 [Xenoophorus captivus]|uniref:Uncharacterized protein n=1 Tax=Xenoophorus captivus TaxID=1517983 RepID=A0ABV0R8A4_9TELE
MEKLSSAFNPSLREQWAAVVQHPGSIQGQRVLLRDPEWQAVRFESGYLWPGCTCPALQPLGHQSPHIKLDLNMFHLQVQKPKGFQIIKAIKKGKYCWQQKQITIYFSTFCVFLTQ